MPHFPADCVQEPEFSDSLPLKTSGHIYSIFGLKIKAAEPEHMPATKTYSLAPQGLWPISSLCVIT